jgi:hypothetical protein
MSSFMYVFRTLFLHYKYVPMWDSNYSINMCLCGIQNVVLSAVSANVGRPGVLCLQAALTFQFVLCSLNTFFVTCLI